MKINPKATLENLGGKGYHLKLLKDICCVPDFFIICFDNLKEIEDISIQEQILNYYRNNKFELVAVRSSATIEDGSDSSFAGMFDSVLNVKEDKLIEAIKKVVNSVKGHRVIEYCKVKGIDYENIGMRIVVQKMINSRVSGVCFTKIPKSSEQMAIEACFGLGEALVSGKVTPDNYIVNRNTLGIEDSSISYQSNMFKRNGYEEVLYQKRNAKKLTNEEIQNISKIALQIESSLKFYGADIEWAFEGDKLYILQARAITFRSTEKKKDSLFPSIQNYQLTFKVTGIGFMFADLLCHGFGYLHPLFICSEGKFLQYFTNEKMRLCSKLWI